MKCTKFVILVIEACLCLTFADAREILYSDYEKSLKADLVIGAVSVESKSPTEMKFYVKDVIKGQFSANTLQLHFYENYSRTTESPSVKSVIDGTVILFLEASVEGDYRLCHGWQGVLNFKPTEYAANQERISKILNIQSVANLEEKGQILVSLLNGDLMDQRTALDILINTTILTEEVFNEMSLLVGTIAALNSPDVVVRRDALLVLGKYRDRSSLPEIVKMLTDDEEAVWSAAESALQDITGRRKILPALPTKAQRDQAFDDWTDRLKKIITSDLTKRPFSEGQGEQMNSPKKSWDGS